MKKKTLALYWALVLNLFLWLGIVGVIVGAGRSLHDLDSADMLSILKFTGIAGCFLAAFLQHWAYYHIYRPAQEEKKQNKAIEGTSQ